MLDKPCIIAVCGKGGVGKTSISAMIVRALLRHPENRILAIDADPAVGLAAALGVDAARTVDDVRNDLISRMEGGGGADKAEMLAMLDYDMLSVLEESKNLAFLAIGRPEKEGCYCRINQLLKDIIASMAQNFDYVVIDGEAGIEQVNRRVMAHATHLVLVSDPSARGLNVAQTIYTVAKKTLFCEYAGLIVNRVSGDAKQDGLRVPSDTPYLGTIPEDEVIRLADAAGKSLIDIADCKASEALRACLEKL